ncbi:hypothetical protein ACFQ3R_14665 [Mesonia ostreae]|uniref:Uncharacterized protein n=1 Tax=Mesonia ostreae TaxID=861110 RepID=A0ABU2KMD3_9FLAO|nr:hypothetical protein [Mesonia ostreae]MDT0295882.1 hypothetical protein [Mesonia ostreae]
MKLTTKINLIRELYLEPDHINFLESLNLDFDSKIDFSNEKIDGFINLLDNKLEELIQREDEPSCLNLAYIISIIEQKRLTVNLDFNDYPEYNQEKFEDDDYDDEFINEVEGLTGKEQKKLQKEAVKRYKELDQNIIVSSFKRFVIKNYPQILKGFDRSIYSSAKLSYWKKEHLFDLWQIPTKVYEKVKSAEYEVEEKLREEVDKYAEHMYSEWYKNYKIWLQKNGLKKSTKLNIKDYFKSIKVKPSATIIERIKENYSPE